MKKVLFALLFICFSIGVQAQRVYFIYLQSENGAPFYVKMGDNIHSSTASGYVILSSLKDSTYLFSLGFPGPQSSETKFSIPLANGDKGFLIKNVDDGLNLFDLQTLTLFKPFSAAIAGSSQHSTTRTDPFTKLLSQTSNDASLLTVSVPVTEEAVKKGKGAKETSQKAALEKDVKVAAAVEESSGEIKEDVSLSQQSEVKVENQKSTLPPPVIAAVLKEEAVASEQKAEELKPLVKEEEKLKEKVNEPFVRSVISQKSESSTTEGFGLIFLDEENGRIDTIQILIPNPKKWIKEDEPSKDIAVQEKPLEKGLSQPVLKDVKKASCTNIATTKDFLKLRKNMAAETNDEAMIAEARKFFKTKCFTTDQIRNLSGLFLTSAAKYQFFDASFGHVSDSSEFSSLGVLIKDEYYAKRFKALIGE